MPNKELLLRKLAEILKQLDHLTQLTKLKENELASNESQFYFAERVMERLIGAAIDINMHLVSDLAGEVPENYFDSFIALGKLKILPLPFAKKIALSASLRNILVHEYQQLDFTKFYEALTIAQHDYMKYAKRIQKFLD